VLEIRSALPSDPLGARLGAFLAHSPPAATVSTTVTLVSDPGRVELAPLLAAAADGRAPLLAAVTSGSGAPAALLDAAGVRVGRCVPAHPVRLGTDPGLAALTARLDERPEPLTPLVGLVPCDDATTVLLSAPAGLERLAVATWRPATGVLLVGFDPAALLGPAPWGPSSDPGLRLLHRLVLLASGNDPAGSPLPAVGLLGYGAIAAEHVAGFRAAGFEVTAVCDRSDARLAAAAAAAPGVRTYAKADELLGDPDVGLIAVSTPPDSHARWAGAALERGRHVVVEKPLALTTADADAMLRAAEGSGLTLAVYQNRRFDPDFLALERLVRSGRLGQVFHVEAFVGGYDHPCNYWHSDAGVSGGTAFDWGSHYLDQLLALLPSPVSAVQGSAHKLRWHDVTNADQMRIQLRFADGAEADFVHSDLAAALKPKWYVLGSEGAAVATWRREKVVGRSSVGLLDEDILAPADSPAELRWHLPDGSTTELALPVAAPGRFHRELADRLSLGEALTADPRQSRDVVAVLEAAVASADAGGTIVRPDLLTR